MAIPSKPKDPTLDYTAPVHTANVNGPAAASMREDYERYTAPWVRQAYPYAHAADDAADNAAVSSTTPPDDAPPSYYDDDPLANFASAYQRARDENQRQRWANDQQRDKDVRSLRARSIIAAVHDGVRSLARLAFLNKGMPYVADNPAASMTPWVQKRYNEITSRHAANQQTLDTDMAQWEQRLSDLSAKYGLEKVRGALRQNLEAVKQGGLNWRKQGDWQFQAGQKDADRMVRQRGQDQASADRRYATDVNAATRLQAEGMQQQGANQRAAAANDQSDRNNRRNNETRLKTSQGKTRTKTKGKTL